MLNDKDDLYILIQQRRQELQHLEKLIYTLQESADDLNEDIERLEERYLAIEDE